MTFKSRLFFAFILLVIIYYTKPWFNLYFILGSVNLDITYLYLIFLLCYILLEYREYKHKEASNEFYHFFFWFFYILCGFLLYISCIKVFILTENIHDFLIHFNSFQIQIIYSFEYKLDFAKKNLIEFLAYTNFSTDKKSAFINIIINCLEPLLINDPQLTLSKINDNLARFIVITDIVYENIPSLTLYIDSLLYQTTFHYKLLMFIKNSFYAYGFTHVLINMSLKLAIKLYFKDYLPRSIYEALSEKVFFDMTEIEIQDLCELLSIKILQRWESFEILKFIFRK